MNKSELKDVKKQAKKLSLDIVLKTSSTKKDDIDKVLKVAKHLDVKNIRVYNRYGGYVKDSIQNCIADLRNACKLAEQYDLHFVIESHEAMKPSELIQIIKEVNSQRLKILFDFGNMINGYKAPAYRFKNEGENPNLSIDENLHIEKDNATHQVNYINTLLNKLKTISEERLS